MASFGRKDHSTPTSPEEEQAKVKELRDKLGPLEGRAASFCTDACLHRYLRARAWNVRKAEKMLKETLAWRAEVKPEEIKWEDVAEEGETGKMYRTNFLDKKGDSVLVMAPGRQNTQDHDSQIRHLVYCLENATICLPPGREHMVWLIDFRGWTLRMSPPLKTTRETVNILQNHYPERLGAAVLYNAPQMFEAFWKMVRPFLDPKTAKKVVFLNSKSAASLKHLEQLFDLDTLEKTFGGRSTWEYNHAEYSKLMKEDDLKTALRWGLPVPEKSIPAANLTPVVRSAPTAAVAPISDPVEKEGEEQEYYDGKSVEQEVAELALRDDDSSSVESEAQQTGAAHRQGLKQGAQGP